MAEEGADEQLVDAGDGLRPRQHAVAVDRGQGDKVAIRSGQTSRVMVILLSGMCGHLRPKHTQRFSPTHLI